MAKLSRAQRKKAKAKGQVVAQPKKVKLQTLGYKQTLAYKQKARASKPITKKSSKEDLRQRKIDFLRSQGIDPFKYRKKDIDSIKIKDIKSNNFNAVTYPIFFVDSWETVKDFSPRILLISYCDFSGNQDIADIIRTVSGWSIEQLIAEIKEWLYKPLTGQPKIMNSSSGKAGEVKLEFAEEQVIRDFVDMRKEETKKMKWSPKRGKWKTHKSGDNIGWQNITTNSPLGITSASGKTMLVLCASIIANILENDRQIFYGKWYRVFAKEFPQFKDKVPQP